MISKNIAGPDANSKLLLCGPPPMIKAMQQCAEDLGFEAPRAISKVEDQVFKF
jgi:cytochrome-b5 reductase